MNTALQNGQNKTEPIIINEVQLLLAEKRTSLAVMRTGITVLILPFSVLSVLIATSRYYDIFHVMHFMLPLLALCLFLIILGIYLIIRSVIRIHSHDRHILEIKRMYSQIAKLLE